MNKDNKNTENIQQVALEKLVIATEKNASNFEQHSKEDHQKFEQMIIHQNATDKKIDLNHEELKKILTPIAETYGSVSKMAKWLMAVLVLVSIIVGILVGLKNLFK